MRSLSTGLSFMFAKSQGGSLTPDDNNICTKLLFPVLLCRMWWHPWTIWTSQDVNYRKYPHSVKVMRGDTPINGPLHSGPTWFHLLDFRWFLDFLSLGRPCWLASQAQTRIVSKPTPSPNNASIWKQVALPIQTQFSKLQPFPYRQTPS